MLDIPTVNDVPPKSAARPSPDAPAVILFDHVTLAFDEKVVLDDVSFTLRQGYLKLILGASGAGKSTILRLILGLLKADAGSIIVNGHAVHAMQERELMAVRAELGMVFQEGALFDSLTVRENVGFKLFEQTDMPIADVDAHTVATEQDLRTVRVKNLPARARDEVSDQAEVSIRVSGREHDVGEPLARIERVEARRLVEEGEVVLVLPGRMEHEAGVDVRSQPRHLEGQEAPVLIGREHGSARADPREAARRLGREMERGGRAPQYAA